MRRTDLFRPRSPAWWRRRDWSRRDFLLTSGASAAAWMLACDTDSSGPGAPGAFDSSAMPMDASLDGLITPSCEETEENIEGPFYRAGAPERDVLVSPSDPGVRLTLTGRVYLRDTKAHCEPIAGALLDFWQADDAATYDGTGFDFRGQQFCAADGSYSLQTIIPGHYLNGTQYRPAHIHVKASGTGAQLLTTQIYFEGDPYNDIDPFIHPALVMPWEDDGAGGRVGRFDIVLAPA